VAGQHRFQVFTDRKAGALDQADGIVVAAGRCLDELLRHRLERAQHQRHRAQPHHFERTGGLVHLLARQRRALTSRCRARRRGCAASRTWRRKALIDPSRDLRSSSSTQARGPDPVGGIQAGGATASVERMRDSSQA
jgi:hypothetical protein